MVRELKIGALVGSSNAEATYLFDRPPTITVPATSEVVAAEKELYQKFGAS